MRKLTKNEIILIEFMLELFHYQRPAKFLESILATELSDGGMGSLRFATKNDDSHFARELGQINLLDTDSIPLNISINLDQYGELYELDVFKVDFSSLKQFPVPPFTLL